MRTSLEEGLQGRDDPVHLAQAIRDDRVLLTRNHDDFAILDALVLTSGGHHPGIMVVRRDNDPSRDMTPRGVTVAVRKLETSGVRVTDLVHVLNHWR